MKIYKSLKWLAQLRRLILNFDHCQKGCSAQGREISFGASDGAKPRRRWDALGSGPASAMAKSVQVAGHNPDPDSEQRGEAIAADWEKGLEEGRIGGRW